MGISGIMLVLFLALHLTVNLTSLVSRSAYESVWQLKDNSILFQVIVSVLVIGFLTHVICGIIASVRNLKIQEANRNNAKNNTANTWKNMLALGIIVIGLLIFHLSHFWAKIQLHSENPYDIVKTLFYNGFYVAIYVIWIIALYYHLSHGFWNMFQSINTKNSKLIYALQVASRIFIIIIALGFISIPVYFYLGFGNA